MEMGNGNVPADIKKYSSKNLLGIALLIVILIIAGIYLYLNKTQTKDIDNGIVQKNVVNNNTDNNQKPAGSDNNSAISAKDITVEAEKGSNYNREETGEEWSDAYKIKAAGVEIGEIKQDGPFNVIRLAETSDKLFLTTESVGLGGNYPRGATVYNDLYAVDLKSKIIEKIYANNGNVNGNGVKAISHDGNNILVKIVSGEGLNIQIVNLSSQENSKPTFQVSKEYTDLGYAAFSPDDTKIVMEARIGEAYCQDSDCEKYVSFGVELATGKSTQFSTYEEAKKWAGIN